LYREDIFPVKECKRGGGSVRVRSLAALKRIKDRKDKAFISGNYRFTYDTLFREYILQRLLQGYEFAGCRVPADRKVKNFVKKGNIKNS
jgi:hypothetical protein